MNSNYYFNDKNSTELKERIFQLIRGANRYIKTGNFLFKDSNLNKVLLEAVERGVAIFVLSNIKGGENRSKCSSPDYKDETDPHIPNLHELHRKGIHVHCNDNLHAKFLICDGAEGLLMSANYTPDSLSGNPESGVDLFGNELIDMEFVFDKLFMSPDIKLSEDGKEYRYLKSEKPLPEDTFNQVGSESRLRLTAASQKQTNLAKCHVRTLYDSILDIINKAEKELTVVSWSFKNLENLPEFNKALEAAIDRMVNVHIYYNNKAETKKVEITEGQLKKLHDSNFFKQNCHPFPYNHSKCVISEKDGILFTSNIDGWSGLLSGFEVGCLLNENQRNKALLRIKQNIQNGK